MTSRRQLSTCLQTGSLPKNLRGYERTSQTLRGPATSGQCSVTQPRTSARSPASSTSKTSTTRVVTSPLVSTSRANPSASQKPDRARTINLKPIDQQRHRAESANSTCRRATSPSTSHRIRKHSYGPKDDFILTFVPTGQTDTTSTSYSACTTSRIEYSRHRKTPYGPETNLSDVLFHARSNRVQSSP